jgi:hypothetical protein
VPARLATLQRLRDPATAGRRSAMLRTIEQMIEQETKALRELRDLDDEPA